MKTQIKALTATLISCIAFVALDIAVIVYPVIALAVCIAVLCAGAGAIGYVLYGIFYDWFKSREEM